MTFGLPLDIITGVIGTALMGSGLYGIVQPLSMARAFGLVQPTPEAVIFYPGLAGRNLAMAQYGARSDGARRHEGRQDR